MVASRELALIAWQRGRGRPQWLRRLEADHGPVEEWWSDRAAILRAAGLHRDACDRLASPTVDEAARRDVETLDRLGWRPVDPSSVTGLGDLPEPPLLLFARGGLQLCDATPSASLAVVGARRATGYGLRITRRLVGELAAVGVTVISGLARGIDATAHAATLDVGGITVAVLGAGPDVVYPPEHGPLQERIVERGLLLTEHLPGEPPRPGHFPHRNRVLVALAQALLVVEARIKSGTLTSVRWAADLGRDVLVVPGPVDTPLAEGPLQLLREGATPVGSASHVLEELGLSDVAGSTRISAQGRRVSPDDVSNEEERILTWLAGDGLDLDELVGVSGEPPGRLLTVLLALEVRGRVERDPGGLRFRAS